VNTRGRFSPAVRLGALALLAAIVVARVAAVTYWSWHDASRSRTIIAWALGLVVLAMLARLASHVRSDQRARRASSAP
jgi:TctA family transporter